MKEITKGVDWETTEVEASDETGDKFQIGEETSDNDNEAYT